MEWSVLASCYAMLIHALVVVGRAWAMLIGVSPSFQTKKKKEKNNDK